MTQTEAGKAFLEFWANQGETLKRAQAKATKAFTDGLQAMSSSPFAFPQFDASRPDLAAGTADLGRASQAFTDLWSSAAALSKTLAGQVPGAAGGDKTVETAITKMLDPTSWMGGRGEMDDVLARMADGPRFADLWEVERLYARVVSAWVEVRRTSLEHHAVVLDAWIKAARQFSEQLARRTEAEVRSQTSKALMARWTDTANKQLLETQRSDTFLRTQSAMIRSATDLRLAQRDLIEHFGRQYGFPTRTELDDVHRSVTELRRELRAMERRTRRAAPPAVAVTSAVQPDHEHAG